MWAGCGGGDDHTSPTAAAVAQAFANARNDRDIAETCSLYAHNIQDQLNREYGGCQDFYEQQTQAGHPGGGSHLVAVDVRESGDRAKGQLLTKKGSMTTTFQITLVREDGQWRVSSFQF
jgi:hypothetical protein